MNKNTPPSLQSSENACANGTKIIDNLATARLLSDPLKLKILKQFTEEPRTTKQVADLLHEKAPKLYRHVDSLLEHGLLKNIREQPKRGTIERYLQATAARFEVDSRLFASDNDNVAEARETLRSFLRKTEDELIHALNHCSQTESESPDNVGANPMILSLSIKASQAQVADLRQRLIDWVQSCESLPEPGTDEELLDFNGLVTFYPVKDDD